MKLAYDCYIAFVSPRFDMVEPLERENVVLAMRDQMGKGTSTEDSFA